MNITLRYHGLNHVLCFRQPSVLLVFLLVSEEETFTANSAISNDGIELMARKNHGERQPEHDGSH